VTAGYRKACGQECYLFEPFAEDRRTARWNPFHYVSEDPIRRINDLQRIADMLYPDPPTGDPFWVASARSVFLAIALYVFETGTEEKTIGNVLRHGMAGDEKGFGEYWKGKVEGRKSGPNPLSEYCVRALYDVIDLAPSTASSIRKTFTSRLDLWLNPILDAATSGNDFDLRDLRRKPMSIYVGVNPDDLHRLRPVLNLFFQQAIGLQTRELPEHNPELKHQVMMLLDEFTALGRIPIIAESISYLPGYNVRVVLVIQTPAQLREVYGPHNAETMLKSLATRIVYAPKDVGDAREISEELGYLTVKVKSQSRPRQTFSSSHRGGGSETTSEQKRALQLPQEIKALPPDQEIIFYEGLPPIRCTKIRYFADPVFTARLLPPPDRPVAVEVKYRVMRKAATAGESAQARGTEPVPIRIAVPEDVLGSEPLSPEEIAGNFTLVQLHVGADGRVPEESLDAGVKQFADTLFAFKPKPMGRSTQEGA
jgi:type IV secretion system protein VirD4